MELYTLAENCNYGDLTSEMMRDRLVVGIQDETLSQKLQQMHHLMGLEQSYYSNITLNGNQLHMPLVQCQRR